MKASAADSASGARRTGPAVESMYRFAGCLVPTVEKFPRRQKFLLGDRLQATGLDVLERPVEATYTRERRRHLQAATSPREAAAAVPSDRVAAFDALRAAAGKRRAPGPAAFLTNLETEVLPSWPASGTAIGCTASPRVGTWGKVPYGTWVERDSPVPELLAQPGDPVAPGPRRTMRPAGVTDGCARSPSSAGRLACAQRSVRDRFRSAARENTMQTVPVSALVLFTLVYTMSSAAAQTPVGALAVDERQGDQYGWAVDYETAPAAQARALSECGGGCRVVLTFARCAAYAADQDADSTAVGWAESYASSSSAQQAALSACSSRGGTGCIVRVWGCNGPVVEEGLGLDRAARRQIQRGLEAAGFDPGGADGMFGPRTRAAIRGWQTSRGSRATGYLDGPTVAALRPSALGQPTFRERKPAGAAAAAAPAVSGAQQPAAASAELEGLFWQSVMNSTNPAEFEAYLRRFPDGLFSELAEARLAALRAPAGMPPGAAGAAVGGARRPAAGSRASGTSGSRVAGAAGASFGGAAAADARLQPGAVFRDCDVCPELVVMPDGRLALGRYEVTVGEYRAFASATGREAGACFGDTWQNPGFGQTDRHPVTCVSWDDAQAYVSWLSRTAGATYRLPTEAEWDRAAAGSQRGCDRERTGTMSTCPVGSYGANGAGLSDMVGNLFEWTEDCYEGDCGRRVLRGGSWLDLAGILRPGARDWLRAGLRYSYLGFRVARTLD